QEAGFNRGYYDDSPAIEPGRRHAGRRYPTGPKGYTRSDERIREDISERLMRSFHIDSSEVTVQVLGGRVTLEGTVPSRHMKHTIEDVADTTTGVQDVDNRIRVVGLGRDTGGSATNNAGSVGNTPGVGSVSTTGTGVSTPAAGTGTAT